MPAAVLLANLSEPGPGAIRETGPGHLAVFDDPGEWATFSQPAEPTPGKASADTTDLWESQVVVRGMHCAACSLTLEQALLGIQGVVSAQVSAASQRASIVWSAALTRPSKWMRAPLALGYRLLPASDAFSSDHGRRAARLALWRWLVAGFCMMQVMMYATPAYVAGPGDITPDIQSLLRWASWVLSLPVVFFSCTPFFANALRDLRRRRISMDLPVALGIVIIFAVSSAATFEPQGRWGQEVYFDSLTMFVFFLLTGRWLEQRLRARTAGALDSLMQRLPDSVERQQAHGGFERVTVRRLVVGDLVRVLPGEAFPADGTIVLGDTFVDEALLTGESRPVTRPLGASVLAGSHNLSAAVQVRIEKIGESTLYAQIVALMARAAVDKPRLAVQADRVAKPFLGFVLLAAALAAAYWWGTDPARGLMAAVAVLVVTCPCALSLATPTAMLTSAGLLARHGVLVRRLRALEDLASIDTVIFDKTGTLTEARMGLRGVSTRAGVTSAEALQLAGALAQHSLHPVSRALVTAANSARLDHADTVAMPDVAGVREIPGCGLEGRLGTAPGFGFCGLLRLGSARFCQLDSAAHDSLQVYLTDESGWLAGFDLDEVIRPDAHEAVTRLHKAGLEVQMLSGDSHAAASSVARRLGIKEVQGDCTPQNKLERLQALQQQGRKVLMVGDGLNDGPVLARAHVSVALGQAVPLAQAQSDLVMPGGQLLMLPKMLAHARHTLRIVRQNLCWAAVYNAVCVPLALMGWLPAWLAGLGMALSSLLVIANAARLSRLKEKS
ncbi:heavy metal translocating P-type ATPase [Polaromonas sp.]|uniref:heavy metal translocating P-type ATPase n=1 Tax=Polaromonas sp. TaxID=1869339 RepID=UPI002FCB5D59